MDRIKEALEEKGQIGFEISNPQKSFTGYTVYRLQLKVCMSGNTHYYFLGWKRYNDFKKLYKDLKCAFSAEMKSGFPVFLKGKIFGRFDESVIEERREASHNFLQFILSNQNMLFHHHFQSFLNNNEQPSQSEKDLEIVDSVDIPMSYNSLIADDKLVELPANIENSNSDATEDSGLVGDHNNTENTDISLTIENSVDNRQTWLREARSICEYDRDFNLDLPSEQEASVLLDEPLDNDTVLSPSSCDGLELTDQSPEEIGEIEGDKEQHTKSMDSLAISEDSRREIPSFHHKLVVDDKMSQKIEETVQQDDYIFQASVAMSNAIDQEEIGDYDGAFDMYKFGIGLLLRGVQEETNLDKREAVRKKTAQYLMRAEELYLSSLKTTYSKKAKSFPINIGEGKGRFRLSDVRVFGIIKNVLLVQKRSSPDVYVMKVLHKKGGEYKSSFYQKRKKTERNLYNCRFMTKLINCVETETGVYLLLEYVAGGRLWDHLNLPVFSCRQDLRCCTVNEHCYSWSNTDFSSNTNVDISDNHGDTIDIECKTESHEKVKRRTSSITCRLKRSSSQNNGFAEEFIRLWAAQIALGLMTLHNYGIICRDLNPKNIMIDNAGNIKLTYFSNVEGMDDTLDPNALTLLYASPEVEQVFELNNSTDWWSYGAIIFELLMGESLYSCHPNGINSHSIITLPKRVSNEACSLLASFLRFNPRDRLGCGPNGSEEIKYHPFFSSIDWESI